MAVISTKSTGVASTGREFLRRDLWVLLAVAALVMAAGWGIRGSFGHSRGAMMPGAMLGLSLAVCSRRADWWGRAAIIGLLSAIGWGFGGASSYGMLIGYSLKPDWSTSAYGYASLFLVGALYGGIGGACLALALTARRSFLESAVGPLVLTFCLWLLLEWLGVQRWSLELFAKDPSKPEVTQWLYDTLWICAVSSLVLAGILWPLVPRWRQPLQLIMVIAIGWFVGMAVLIGLLGLRINPSRADSWAGCVGVMVAFIGYLAWHRNRAGILLCAYGLISGGLGFVIGEFVQALGRGRWGVIGSYPVLQEFGYWTLMEQIFGACMGLGMGLAVWRLVRGQLKPAEEDIASANFNTFAVFSLLGLIPVFNLITNVAAWRKEGLVPELVLGLPAGWILTGVGMVWLVLLWESLRLYRRGELDVVPGTTLGKARSLALAMSALVMVLYALLPAKGLPTSLCFVAALSVAAWLLLRVPREPVGLVEGETHGPESEVWRLTWRHGLFWLAAPIAICLFAYATTLLNIPGKN